LPFGFPPQEVYFCEEKFAIIIAKSQQTMSLIILAIESSCDDTAAAVVRDGVVLSNCVANQTVHEQYGGVVPEVASRAHQANIIPVVDAALKKAGVSTSELHAVGFTRGPGLMGSLLVGVSFAKSFALIGGFISSDEQIIEYLRYNMRSQIFAKSLPLTLVVGALKRLELMRNHPEYKDNLWKITNALQSGLKKAGFEIGETNSCVTPVYMNGSIPEATNLILDLRENYNVFCSMVVYPVVPKGMIILRLIPTAVHSMEDVNYTIECFSKIVGKLKAGEYMSDKIAAF
jgi:hypothetical protein